jgi:hypothetical protein
MLQMKRFGFRLVGCVACLGILLGALAPAVAAQKKSHDPYSIMTDEPQAPAPRKRVKRARGSSSPSPVPPYQSTLTPLGVAPQIVTTPPLGQPGAPSVVVPGVGAGGGPAVTPSRPAGQTFQDRALSCVHSGSAQGVGPGQIGAFTQSCVNQ